MASKTSRNIETPTPLDNTQIVLRFIEECWNAGRTDMVVQNLASNVRIHDPVFPNLTVGANNMRQHIEACRRGFPDIKFQIEDTISERNEVVVHWTARGTHEGDFLGMQPTYRPAVVTGTSIYRLNSGKIVEQWAHWNLMTMMEQLGAQQGQPARH
jgi:steroid delta-isomerase-like uncharacterized protein